MRDPRIQQTLNQVSEDLSTVVDSARIGCFTFTKSYIEPCFQSLKTCTPSVQDACPCCYADNHYTRRRRRGTAEYSFEFYNSDFDDDAGRTRDLLGWDHDELDRLLAGSGATREARVAGVRNDGMHYVRRGGRKISLLPKDGVDPTLIPKTQPFGLFSFLPWSKTLKYKPSAADLQEHPGGYGATARTLRDEEEEESLLGDTHEALDRRGRGRSGTASSNDTTDTFRSRTDLIPSEDEDDAVPLDDEFADTFDFSSKKGRRLRRTRTNDTTSGMSTGGRSLSTPGSNGGRKTPQSDEARISNGKPSPHGTIAEGRSDEDLRQEEETIKREEEEVINMKRQAAKSLAMQRGLSFEESPIRERAESIASTTRAKVQALTSPRARPVQPMAMKDMGLEDPEELFDTSFSTRSDGTPRSPLSPMSPFRVMSMSENQHAPARMEVALPQVNDKNNTKTTNETLLHAQRPPLHPSNTTTTRLYSSLRLDKFIASTFLEAADSETVFNTSPPHDHLQSPPPLTKSFSETALPLHDISSMNIDNHAQKLGENASSWVQWLPSSSLEAAKSFLAAVNVERESHGWDEEEATAERWKETMSVLTDDEGDSEGDSDNNGHGDTSNNIKGKGKGKGKNVVGYKTEHFVVKDPRDAV